LSCRSDAILFPGVKPHRASSTRELGAPE
jgi:hypothetical protein